MYPLQDKFQDKIISRKYRYAAPRMNMATANERDIIPAILNQT